MIGNNDKSRPQYGLDQADMYVEAETEGASPGSWRSSPMPRGFGAAWAGAKRPVSFRAAGPVSGPRYTVTPVAARRGWLQMKNLGIHHIDGLVYDGSTFFGETRI